MIARLLTERAIVAGGDHFVLIDWQLNIGAPLSCRHGKLSHGIIIDVHGPHA